MARRYGDVSSFRLLGQRVYFVNHPDGVQRLLLDRWKEYDKDVVWFGVLRHLVGEGLATVIDHDRWRRRRRLLQPLFHRGQLAALGGLVSETMRSMQPAWDASIRDGRAIDVAEDITQLSLRVLCQAIFRMDAVDARYRQLTAAFGAANQSLADYFHFPFPPAAWRRDLNRQIRIIDDIIDSFIREHRQEGERDDVLTLLMGARDEDTGQALEDRDIRDEVITFLVGGHETTAVTLAWAWYEIARRPEVDRRLHQEVTAALDGRAPVVDDIPRLPYARMVIDETLRLHPALWQMMRHAVEDDEIGGYRVPAGAAMMWSPYTLHRHPAFWPDPERFDPDRFDTARLAPERAAARRFAYTPFGAGPRTCIGMHFALMEIVLVLATVTQRYRLTLDERASVELAPFITLRPRHGVHVYVHRR
jgi:cytochrome P450